MKTILRKQKSAYALSIIFISIWLITVLVTIWKTWQEVSSSTDLLSTFLTTLWRENINFISGLQFKLVYLVILGDIMLIAGVITWLLSRKQFLLPGEDTRFKCPFCKKKWKAKGNKALVHCPHCNQLIHPEIIDN